MGVRLFYMRVWCTHPACKLNSGQVLAAVGEVAKHTNVLCMACKDASVKTPNQMAKQNFITSAKAIAGCTTALVPVILLGV